MEKMEKKEKIILTGDRPTDQLHVGHYVGSLRRRVELQNSGEYDKIFIMIADAQALTDNADNPEKVRQNIIEVALDYLACGLDPEKSTLLIQSQIPELCELSFYYMNLINCSGKDQPVPASLAGKPDLITGRISTAEDVLVPWDVRILTEVL